MKVKFNAAGSDIIPNKAFWLSVPFLIKVRYKTKFTTDFELKIFFFLRMGVCSLSAPV